MLISLLVGIIVLGALVYIVQLIPLPEPWKQIAYVLVLLIAVIWLLRILGLVPLGLL